MIEVWINVYASFVHRAAYNRAGTSSLELIWQGEKKRTGVVNIKYFTNYIALKSVQR